MLNVTDNLKDIFHFHPHLLHILLRPRTNQLGGVFYLTFDSESGIFLYRSYLSSPRFDGRRFRTYIVRPNLFFLIPEKGKKEKNEG